MHRGKDQILAFGFWLDEFVQAYQSRENLKPFNITKVKNCLKEHSSIFKHNMYTDKRYIKHFLFLWMSKLTSSSEIEGLVKRLNN